jgi:hypothetical protein
MHAADPEELALKAEAWAAGQLAWKLKPYQYVVYETVWNLITQLRDAEPSEDEYRVGTVVACRKIGKSFIESLVSFEFGNRFPGSIIRISAPTALEARSIFLPEFHKILADCPLELRPKPRGVDHDWYFPNGSMLVLRGIDANPDGLRGPSSDLNWVDEAAYVKRLQYAVDSILYPMTVNTRGPTILCSTLNQSPNAEFNEYYKRCKSINQAAVVDVYSAGFSQRQITAEKNAVSPTTWAIEYECREERNADMTVVPEWTPEVAAVLTAEAPHGGPHVPEMGHWQRFTSCDWGTSDNTVILTGYYSFADNKVWITQEGMLQGAAVTAGNVARIIKDLEAADNEERPRHLASAPILRFGDHDIPMLQSLQVDQRLPIQMVNKGAGLEGMINLFRSYVSQGRISIDPRCVNLLGCLEHAAWVTRASSRKDAPRERVLARSALVDANKQVLGHFDALMAAVYLVVSAHARRAVNPLPTTFVTAAQEQRFGTYSPERFGSLRTSKPSFTRGWVPPTARQKR